MRCFVLGLFALSLFAVPAEAGIFKKLFKRRGCARGSCYSVPAAISHPAQKATQKASQKASQKSPAAQKGLATPPPPSAFNGESSYERALRLAETEPQHVLFVAGDAHNQEVARILALVRGANLPAPHVVDLAECSDELRQQAYASRQGAEGAFLQTIHPARSGHYSHGRVWWLASELETAEQFASWSESNKQPFVRVAYVPRPGDSYQFIGRNGYVWTYTYY